MEKEPQKQRGSKQLTVFLLLLAIGVLFVGRSIANDPQAALARILSIALVAVGFGAVIFVHELGHFVAAKSVGIFVEAFSLGFGPIILAAKKVPPGLRISLLPSLIPSPDGNGKIAFTVPLGLKKQGETQYRISLVPLGGFVKMLGQEDTAADQPSNNPRAYPNKPVWQRSIVIVAGVTMNVIAALIAFGFLFGHGIKRPAAVVGSVNPDKPAAQAGIMPGDKILAIDGKENISHINLKIAAAFADPGEKIALKVEHPNGELATYHVAPQPPQTDAEKDQGVKLFGIGHSYELLISPSLHDQPALREHFDKLGLQPGDRIVAVNDLPIERYYQLHEQLYPLAGKPIARTASVTIERPGPDGQTARHRVPIEMQLAPAGAADIQATLLGMMPRSRVAKVLPESPAEEAGLLKGDIILRMGPINNPTTLEFIDYCKAHRDQDVDLLVSRVADEKITQTNLTVVPRTPKDAGWLQKTLTDVPPRVGVIIDLDLEHPIVAKLNAYGAERFSQLAALPRGARLLAIGQTPVNNWTDIMTHLASRQGQQVTITYTAGADQPAQTVDIALSDNHSWAGFAFQPDFGDYAFLPLEPLQITIKGDTWLDNLNLGLDTTFTTLATSYLTIKGMIQGQLGAKAVSGPVGILKMSYTIASERDLADYAFFMAFISVCVAFFNIMPLPILDGGHLVFLLIERIKGSPVSPKIQEVVAYIGLFLIGGLFLLLTYQDIIEWVSGQI